MRRTRHSSLLLLCILLVSPGLFAQGISYDEQLSLVAPSTSGETGLFTTITGDTLRQGDWSFSIYLNDYDLLAAPAPDFAPLTGRGYHDMGYDDYQLSLSVGYGITDRWEFVAMLPYHRLVQNANDRAGFINGYLYDEGAFTDNGLGNIHLGTKFALLDPSASSSRLALSAFMDAPTGDDDGGIATGNPNFGFGVHWSAGIAAVSGIYKIVGSRDADATPLGQDFDLPNEIHLDAGLNVPLRFFPTTNWISEVNSTWYTGGDREPDNPVFLVTGIRHWFGQSGWALNLGARWNVTKWSDDNEHCELSELDDCALSALVGLTFAPFHLAQLAAPPPPPVIPLPPPPPAPVPPPPTPVVPPSMPRELRTDEIHFEPASARLTNIAKAILDDVALRMKQEPSATAIVIGYTDNREATGPNNDLDRRRAEAARDYLVSRHGIDPSRITVEGRGTSDPIGDNSTAAGRLANRRVVIRLMIP